MGGDASWPDGTDDSGTGMSGYLRPCDARISSTWQGHRDRSPSSSEPGTDWACAYGTPLAAAGAGRVADVKHTTTGATGRYVTIDLDDGRRVRYLHLSRISVSVGQRVTRGQIFARSGASGFGSNWGYGAHVHVTLWERHGYSFGRNATLDFEKHLGAVAAPAVTETASPVGEEEDDMYIANVKGGNFYLVIGKQAHALGAESGARESGIPVLNYVDDWAVGKLRAGGVTGIGNH